jgi:calcineurin-like phosphoesterase family protein
MLLIGDIHAQFHNYRATIINSGAVNSLQLGDFGLGFPRSENHFDMSDVKGTHLFIRGNHDNPEVCRKDCYYAGDFGIMNGSFIDGAFDKLFFMSGAWSIDQAYRIPKLTWWEEEQLSYKELNEAANLYKKEKPEIVCSHDCPTFILNHLHHHVIPTRTSQAMDAMFMFKEPALWFFAHHHMSWRMNIRGCWFVCLNEMETLDISKRVVHIPQ